MGCLCKLILLILIYPLFIRILQWLYHHFRSSAQRANSSKAFDADTQTANSLPPKMRYLRVLMPLLARIAKSDGRVSEQEISNVERIFVELNLSPSERLFAQRIFSEAKDSGAPFSLLAQRFANACYDFEMRVITFQFMVRVAYADGTLTNHEIAVLFMVANQFGLPLELINAILMSLSPGAREQSFRGENTWEYTRRHRGQSPRRTAGSQRAQDLALLGLPPGASQEEIKHAYRQKVKELHPDRLQAQGLPESMLRQASDRMANINAAYDRLKT